MELILLTLFYILLLVWSLGIGLFIGALMGYFYHSYYNDGSERTGMRAWPAFRRILALCLAPIVRTYFPFEISYVSQRTSAEELETLVSDYLIAGPSSGAAIFSAHPHGLFAISSFCLLTSLRSHWLNLRPATHRMVFSTPLLRELALWLGAIDVSRENLCENLEQARSVFIVPGGCREMIRADRSTRKDMERVVSPKAVEATVFAVIMMCLLVVLVGVALMNKDIPTLTFASVGLLLLGTLLVVAVWQTFVEENPTQYDIQTEHVGFLQLAFEKKVPVFPILHCGQERVFRAYSFPLLDRFRTRMLDLTGYPFPSLFLGPFPSKLTTYIYDPILPSDFVTVEAFTEAYYTFVRSHYATLCSGGL